MKAFADDKINVTKELKFVLGRKENFEGEVENAGSHNVFFKGREEIIGGKRRKCWLPAFSPFPTMFSKGFAHRGFKSRDCAIKGIKS